MGRRTRKNSYNKKPSKTDSPFHGPSLGPFTGTGVEIANLTKDAALEGVELGSKLTRDALEPKPLPLWTVLVYILILIFAIVVLFVPTLSEYKQIAIGFILGQGSLVIKSRLQSE
jgi:hypothetical protein